MLQESIYIQKARTKNNCTGYHRTTGLSETNLVSSHYKFLFPIQVGWAYVDTLWIHFQFSYYLEERQKWSLRKWTGLSSADLIKLKNLALRSYFVEGNSRLWTASLQGMWCPLGFILRLFRQKNTTHFGLQCYFYTKTKTIFWKCMWKYQMVGGVVLHTETRFREEMSRTPANNSVPVEISPLWEKGFYQ